jgi:hypothetical protein
MTVVVLMWAVLMAVAITSVVKNDRMRKWRDQEAQRIENDALSRAKQVSLEGEPGTEQWIGTGGRYLHDGIELTSRELVVLAADERIALPLRSQVVLIASAARIDNEGNVYLPAATRLILYEPVNADSLVLRGTPFEVHRAGLLSGNRILLTEPGVQLFAAPSRGPTASPIYAALIVIAGLYAAAQRTPIWNVIIWLWALLLAIDGLRDWPWMTFLLTDLG